MVLLKALNLACVRDGQITNLEVYNLFLTNNTKRSGMLQNVKRDNLIYNIHIYKHTHTHTHTHAHARGR